MAKEKITSTAFLSGYLAKKFPRTSGGKTYEPIDNVSTEMEGFGSFSLIRPSLFTTLKFPADTPRELTLAQKHLINSPVD